MLHLQVVMLKFQLGLPHLLDTMHLLQLLHQLQRFMLEKFNIEFQIIQIIGLHLILQWKDLKQLQIKLQNYNLKPVVELNSMVYLLLMLMIIKIQDLHSRILF